MWQIGIGALGAVLTMVGACASPRQSVVATDFQQLRPRAIECLRRGVEYRPNPVVRATAVEGIERSRCGEAAAWVRAALVDEHPAVRFAACLAVGRSKDELARGSLLELIRDEDASVRVGAAFALHQLGDTRFSGLMPDALLGDPTPQVRCNAAMVLGGLGSRGVVKVLARSMRDPDTTVRNHALEAMARLGNPDAQQQLMFMANSGIGPEEVFAIQALAVTGERKYEELFLGKMADDVGRHIEIRLAAARAMGLLGRPEGLEVTMRGLRFDRPSLNEPGDPPAAQILRARVMAIAAAGAIGRSEAIPDLTAIMEANEDPRLQVAAATAILQILDSVHDDSTAFPLARAAQERK
jgi:HEAT repeat protein